MDAFDYADVQKAPPPRNISALIWNILTAIVLLVTICIGLVFLTIFINPYSGLNPYQPPTLPPTLAPPTSTPTPINTPPPTWTPTPTIEPTLTFTPRPTSTPIPSPTPYGMPSETPTSEVQGSTAFGLQQGSYNAIPNAFFNQDDPCGWMGVGGRVLDLTGSSVYYVIVQIGGSLEGRPIDLISVTGSTSELGQGGYVFSLADHPIDSTGTLWIQLQDQQGLALSEKLNFNTYGTCEKNLILINFTQIR